MTTEHSDSTSLIPITPGKLNKTNEALAIRRAVAGQAGYVPHLDIDQVKEIAAACNNERDRLIIRFLFDSCLRVSEALSVRPQDLAGTEDGWVVSVMGKGKKRRTAAVSASMVAQLQAYAYNNNILRDRPLFSINRTRVFQIVSAAMREAGIVKPDGVGAVHVLRHSGAIERMNITGNPKAVQEQLGHSQPYMTLRYMKTLAHDESMKIQQGVDFKW